MMVHGVTSFLAAGSWVAGTSALSLSALPAPSHSEDFVPVIPQRQGWLERAGGTMTGLSLFSPDIVQQALGETDIWEKRGTEPTIYFLEWADRATIPLLLLAVGGLSLFTFYKLRKSGGLNHFFPWQRFFVRPEPEPFPPQFEPLPPQPEPQLVPPPPEPQPVLPEPQPVLPPTGIDDFDQLPTPASRRIVTPGEREIKIPTVAKNPDGSFQVPGYSILRELGHGGMGVVFLASKADLMNLRFAIKILKPDLITDANLARFKREADMHGRISSPNTVKIHRYGVVGNQPFMVLEYVEGGNLFSWIQSKKLGSASTPKIEREAASIVIGCLKGLEMLHQNGLVHRDIKPANIFLDENGIPKLGDFGLARPREGESYRVTTEGTFAGTVEYLPTEVLVGEKPDICADIYSLGVTLFEMVTQRLPFEADPDIPNASPLMVKIFNESVPDPRTFNPSLSEAFAAIILKAMNKEKEGRYQTPSEFKDALLDFLKEDVARLNGAGKAPPTESFWQLKG